MGEWESERVRVRKPLWTAKEPALVGSECHFFAWTEMAPAPRVLYLGPKGKRSIDPCGMDQVWMPSNSTNIARKRVQETLKFPENPGNLNW